MSSKLSATIRVLGDFQMIAAQIEKAAEEIQQLQRECIDYEELLDAIETIKAEHPHDIFSFDDDLTHGFNEGWEAACDRIKSVLEAKMKNIERGVNL